MRDNKTFRARYPELGGESLKRPPKGFDPEHEMVEDLERKDFVAFCTMPHARLFQSTFLGEVVDAFKAGKGLNAFLAKAMGLAF